MLVLSRKCKQKIIIDDNIVITVVAVKGNRVRIGIEAPTSISIYREELEPGDPRAAAAGRRTGSPRREAAFAPAECEEAAAVELVGAS